MVTGEGRLLLVRGFFLAAFFKNAIGSFFFFLLISSPSSIFFYPCTVVSFGFTDVVLRPFLAPLEKADNLSSLSSSLAAVFSFTATRPAFLPTMIVPPFWSIPSTEGKGFAYVYPCGYSLPACRPSSFRGLPSGAFAAGSVR